MHMKCLILVSALFWEGDSPLYYLVFWELDFANIVRRYVVLEKLFHLY